MKILSGPASRFWALLFLTALLGKTAVAQTVYQRTFSKNVSDVQRAVDELREASSGRLPTLEGFVEPGDQPIDRYERGFYECTFNVTATAAGGAVVQANAKITAWYKDPSPARSGYRVLVSNGHVENDLLDQIAETLGPNSTVTPSAALGTSAPRSVSTGGLRPQINVDPAPSTDSTEGESSSRKGTPSGPLVPLRPAPSTFAPAAPAGESIESMKARRAADEKQAQDLTAEIKALEEVLHNQVRPTDLAAVKKGGAPIYSKSFREFTGTADGKCRGRISDHRGRRRMGARADIGSFSRLDSPQPLGIAGRLCPGGGQAGRRGARWRRALQSEPARNEQFRRELGPAQGQDGKGDLGRAGIAECEHDAKPEVGVCENAL